MTINDAEGRLIHEFDNLSFQTVHYLDDSYLYALVKETCEPIKHTAYPKAKDKEPKVKYLKQ
jgi:hypothetical protein